MKEAHICAGVLWTRAVHLISARLTVCARAMLKFRKKLAKAIIALSNSQNRSPSRLSYFTKFDRLAACYR